MADDPLHELHKAKPGEEPRAYTTDEVRRMFLEQVWNKINYWYDESRTKSTYGKLTGVAFSILAQIDGADITLPAFNLFPYPHPDDREYHKKHGENWFPDDMPEPLDGLHDLFYTVGRKSKAFREDLEDKASGDLAYEQLVKACANIGYDLTCGECAAVFYTGSSGHQHDPNCKTERKR